MAYNLNDAMNRLPPIQKAALLSLTPQVKSDAVPYWPHVQDAFPYWYNRIETMAVESLAQDVDVHNYTIAMALVIGHFVDSGYKGEQPALAYQWIVGVLDYFKDTRPAHLMSDTYPEELDFLWIDEGGVRITGIPNGTRNLGNSGTPGVQQLAIVFSLDLPLIWEVY